MSIFDKINFIKKKSGNYYSKRVAAQLVFALKMAQTGHGDFFSIIEQAADVLIEGHNSQGAVTTQTAKEAEQILLPLSAAAKKYTLHCVAHAHIDMNWQWGFSETVAITLDTFRTVLKLLDEYPDLTFSQSQASTYRIAEKYDPEIFEQIRAYVKSGRWEISSSTWVEGDKNMAGAESQIRQTLNTKNYFKEKFALADEDISIDFEPDTFGHNSQVPEILSKSGIKYYYHCRGKVGENISRWQAPSGAELLVYQEPLWYNARIEYDMFEHVPEFCDKYNLDFMLKVYGVGDHGGGPARRDIERIADIQSWPVAPTIIFSRYRDFFAKLEKHRDKFELITGEFNYIFSGCYTSQSRIKMANKTAENHLYSAEAATAMSVNFAGGKPYTENYREAWERTLFNQFHDILPGSGIQETREHALGIFQETIGYTYAGRTRALTEIAAQIDTSGIAAVPDSESVAEGGGVGFKGACHSNAMLSPGYLNIIPERGGSDRRIYHFFNFTAYRRTEPVTLTVWDYPGDFGQISVKNENGETLPFTLGKSGGFWANKFRELLIYITVPAFGYSTCYIEPKSAEDYIIPENRDPRVEIYPENRLENEYISAEFDDNMQLIKLTDKESGGEIINSPSAFFKLVTQNHFSGTVMYGNSWVEGFEAQLMNINSENPVFVLERDYANPLCRSIRYKVSFLSSSLEVCVSLEKGGKSLKISAVCDWHERFSSEGGIPALKFSLPLSPNVDEYIYKTPAAYISRPSLHHDVPAIGLACAKFDDAALSLLCDNKYGFKGENNSLEVTLIRSSQAPDPHPESGLQHFSLALAPCKGDVTGLEELSERFSSPLISVPNTSHKGNLPLSASFFEVEGNVTVLSVKTPEKLSNGMILRLLSLSGKETDGTVKFKSKPAAFAIVNNLEQPVSEESAPEGDTIKLTFKANEILSLWVRF